MRLITLNILLADDDIDDCQFFKEALEAFELPTNVIAVHDGEQLMQLITLETYQLPDVLFLDLNMPRKNGFECLSEIKNSKRLNRLPVIIFSTSYEQEVVNQLYKNGAQYFIRKPADFEQFKKIVQYTIQLIGKKNILTPSRENFELTAQNILSV